MSDTLKIKKALTIVPKSTSSVQSPQDGDLVIDTAGDLRQYSSSLGSWDKKIAAGTSERCSYKNLGDFSGSEINGLFFQTTNTSIVSFSDIAFPAGIISGPQLKWSPNSEFLLTSGTTIYQKVNNQNFKILTTGLPAYSTYYQNWSPDGKFIAAIGASPFLKIYQRSDLVFSDIAGIVQPSSSCRSVAWSPNGQYLTVTLSSSPYIETYKRSGTTFTKLANPSVLPSSDCMGAAWSNSGELLAVIVNSATPSVVLYRRTGDTFSQLSYYSGFNFANTKAIQFSPDDDFLSCENTIYKNTNGVLTVAFSVNPNSSMGDTLRISDCSWSSNGDNLYLVAYNDIDVVRSTIIVTRDFSVEPSSYSFSDDDGYNELSWDFSLMIPYPGVSSAVNISPNGEYLALGTETQPIQIKARTIEHDFRSTPILTSPKIKRAGT